MTQDETTAPGFTYTCAECCGIFESDWSQDEANAEAAENFGDQLGDDPAVVCDDCYQMMTAAYPIAEFLADHAE